MNSLESNTPDYLPDEKKPDRLDRIKNHLLNGEELPPTQMEMLDRYRLTLSYMCHKGTIKSSSQAIAHVQQEYNLSYRQAAQVVKDTIELWGDVFKYSNDGIRYLHAERLMALSEAAMKEKDFRSAVAAEKEAAKLRGAYDPVKNDKKQLLNLFQITINRTTDPTVLHQPTEDINHEEIK